MPCVVNCQVRNIGMWTKGNIISAYNVRIVNGKMQFQIGGVKGPLPANKIRELNWVDSFGEGETRKTLKSKKTGKVKNHPKGRFCQAQVTARFYIPDETAEGLRAAGKIGPGRAKLEATDHLTKDERYDLIDLKKKTKIHVKPTLNENSIVMELNPLPFIYEVE